jgi:folate-binding protein YgfZ
LNRIYCLLNDHTGLKEISELEYFRYRVLSGLGEGLELIGHIPMEMNLDLHHGISFTKGCYIGQELVARTQFKV